MSYLAVIGTAFALTFLAELPDKSMFASLVLGTRYRAAAATAVSVGAKSLDVIPMPWVRRITGTILLGLAIYTTVAAVTS
jgi:putative Ca2+/H+ antiporter (TMEM165/GDT1 family)